MRSAVLLRDHGRHDRAWALDVGSGLLTPAAGRCHGFVRPPLADAGPDTGGAAAALYAAAGVLWLQYGDQRWDCDTVSVGQGPDAGGGRTFSVHGERGRDLRVAYPAPDTGPFDPAYDYTDALADDFFLWVAEQLRDTAHRPVLRDHFLTGFEPV